MKRLLLLIPVIAIIGCGLFGGADYYPLAVGNIWTYAGMTTVTTSSVTDTTAKMFVTLKIAANDQTIGGNKVFTSTSRDSVVTFNPDTFSIGTGTSYVREADKAILTYSSLTDSTPDTTLMTDLKANKTWTQIVGNDTIVYTVSAAKEDVVVPAKTYSAWKVKTVWNTGGTPQYFWYADGTGMVKMSYTYTYSTATVAVWYNLTEATIK
jgi:hypothetical protein